VNRLTQTHWIRASHSGFELIERDVQIVSDMRSAHERAEISETRARILEVHARQQGLQPGRQMRILFDELSRGRSLPVAWMISRILRRRWFVRVWCAASGGCGSSLTAAPTLGLQSDTSQACDHESDESHEAKRGSAVHLPLLWMWQGAGRDPILSNSMCRRRSFCLCAVGVSLKKACQPLPHR